MNNPRSTETERVGGIHCHLGAGSFCFLCRVFGLQKWIRFEPWCSSTTTISVLYIEAMRTRALKSSMGVERKAI
jgi:hypothetical protein